MFKYRNSELGTNEQWLCLYHLQPLEHKINCSNVQWTELNWTTQWERGLTKLSCPFCAFLFGFPSHLMTRED